MHAHTQTRTHTFIIQRMKHNRQEAINSQEQLLANIQPRDNDGAKMAANIAAAHRLATASVTENEKSVAGFLNITNEKTYRLQNCMRGMSALKRTQHSLAGQVGCVLASIWLSGSGVL